MKYTLALASALTLAASAFAAEPSKTSPDLTQDRLVNRNLTYNLGALKQNLSRA